MNYCVQNLLFQAVSCCMMEDPNILDIDFSTFNQIEKMLYDRRTLESFLAVLPSRFVSTQFVHSLDGDSLLCNMSPSRYVLTYLGNKGAQVSDLCLWFSKMNFEKALLLLKKDEPLRIIEQPVSITRVYEGADLVLTCRAISFPPPEYLWYKGEKELLLEQDAMLSIKPVRLEDSGLYCCRVIKRNIETNDYSYLYSEPSEVQVICPGMHEVPPPYEEFELHPSQDLSFDSCIVNSEDSSSNLNAVKDRITIVKQPYVHGKVPQGMTLCLSCEATSIHPMNYQWFCNGRALPGETSSQLILNFLYPDPITDDMKWEYKCEIWSQYDRIFTQTAFVELEDANCTTPYVAEGKIAFMIANDTYENLDHLNKPAVDVADLADLLSSMNFKIFAFRNLNLTEMKNAFHIFCKLLKPNVYAVFFFAGHGFELYGQMYLLPVDCSDDFVPHESICTEYILQCMQEMKPALNVLLIDACRKLPIPPELNETSEKTEIPNIEKIEAPTSESVPEAKKLAPGKIFQAKMKNNTVYGYSTSFLYGSYESDSQPNSIFVKYLKKYVTLNKRIVDILMMVQTDLGKDILAKDLQYPLIKSTLSTARKLCDPVRNTTTPSSDILRWSDIKSAQNYKISVDISSIGGAVIAEFKHHMNAFCNGLDIIVFVKIKEGAHLKIIYDMEMDIILDNPEIKVSPMTSFHLKDTKLQFGSNFLFKKQILDLQRINSEFLNGKVILKFCHLGRKNELNFSVDARIARLKLSTNSLTSYSIEEQELQSSFKNCT